MSIDEQIKELEGNLAHKKRQIRFEARQKHMPLRKIRMYADQALEIKLKITNLRRKVSKESNG